MENFSQAFGISGCESIAIFVAQNQGAKKYRRALSGFLRGSVMVVGIGFLFSLLLFFGGGQLVLPFLDGEAESAALGASYLRLMGCFYFLSFMGHSYVGHYRGIGRMNITFWGPPFRSPSGSSSHTLWRAPWGWTLLLWPPAWLGRHRPVPLHCVPSGAQGHRLPPSHPG